MHDGDGAAQRFQICLDAELLHALHADVAAQRTERLGLQLVRRLRQDYPLAEIVAWPPAQAMEHSRRVLQAMAATPGE